MSFIYIVKFTTIEVHDDGDNWPNGAGEIYFGLAVNSVIVASRTRDNPYEIDSGNSIPINQETRIEIPQNASFTVSGWVNEQDSGLSWDDDNAGEFKETYINANPLSTIRSKRLTGDGVDVTVHWEIETVPDLFGGGEPIPPNTEPNLKGVIVYEDWKFNSESDRTGPAILRVRSQRFGVGEYNLAFEPEFQIGGGWGKLMGVRPDSISSLKVGSGYYVELFDQRDWVGNKLEISENTPILQADWNDRTKSMIVRQVPPIR